MGQGEVIRKVVLDGKVAVLLGKKKDEVARITGALFKEIAKELVKRHIVHLDGLGELRLYFRKGHGNLKPTHHRRHFRDIQVMRHYCVSFSKADPFRRAIVERYGSGAKEITDGKVRSRRKRGPGKTGKGGRPGLP
jgi:nucleoid DNA-binding protein